MSVWVTCDWSCQECGQHGSGVRVWPYQSETPEQTAKRFEQTTRQRCLSGCLYVATAGNPEEVKR